MGLVMMGMLVVMMVVLLLMLELQHMRCLLVNIIQLLVGRFGVIAPIFGSSILEPHLVDGWGGRWREGWPNGYMLMVTYSTEIVG